MNVDDEFNPRSRHELAQTGRGWLDFVMKQPSHPQNNYFNGPDKWHLAVTLQSNNPKANIYLMRDRLKGWNNRINRRLIGAGYRKPHLKPQKWRWFAFYEDDPHDVDKTPHWHIIATGGHGLPKMKATRALGFQRSVRRIGTTGIFLPVKVPLVKNDFEWAWHDVMPGGSSVVRMLTDPDEDEIWARYAAKRLTSRRFTTIAEMEAAQSRVVIWTEI
ncbi:hypothetical protein A9320_27175 [Ruegeria sp. PBVC088]|nr:hypothetical protein A9320_27175 [Ruegeria sp. PBVC088]